MFCQRTEISGYIVIDLTSGKLIDFMFQKDMNGVKIMSGMQ